MTLRLLHIAPFFHGGVGIVAYNLTKEFIKMGVDVILASPTSPPLELLRSDVTYYNLRKPLLKDPLYSTEFYVLNIGIIKDFIDREKPDVILTHGPLVIIARAVHDTPIISVIHGTYANEVRWMWNHPIFGVERTKYIMGIYMTYRFDMTLYKVLTRPGNVYLVAVSRNTRRELIGAGALPNKVSSILNGVDKEFFKSMNKDHAKSLVEETLKIRLRDKVLLHVNPGPIKGTHILIKAVAILRRTYGDNFTLLIVGRLEPKTYKEHIGDMVRGLKLEENVKMLGYVEHRLLPMLYNATDVTVVPSYSEGAPLVIPESLTCGTPVIATDVGGNPEYLNMAGLVNYIVEVKQYDFSRALCRKIEAALQVKRRVDYNSITSWSNIVSSYINLFRWLLT